MFLEDVPLDEKKLAEFKRKLEKEKKRLSKELEDIGVGSFKQTQSEITGENSYEDHFADSGTATFERERDLSLERNVKDLLSRVEGALNQLEKGTYGICVRCGREIDFARLKALPYADLCIECKKKEEASW